MNADGSNQHRLTGRSLVNRSPAWSPDGRTIAFDSNRAGNYEIYVMNVDGSHQRRLTWNPGRRRPHLLVAGRADDRLRQRQRRQLRDLT